MTLNIGVFINTIINFTIVAFAVFMVVKAVNAARRRAACARRRRRRRRPTEALLTEIRDLLKTR